MFKEFREVSGGKFEYHIVDPEDLASEYAVEQVDEYFRVKKEGDTPKEPEPVRTIQDIFSGRQGPTGEQLKTQRDKIAQARAAAQGRPKDEVYRELLMEDFKRQFKQKLEQDQIGSFPMTETSAGSVRQVTVYSSIKISYLDKTPEVIPVHYLIESLEYELVSRVIKLTTDAKPVVAIFDARKPDAPPQSPMNPMQRPPPSDYAGIIGALREFFDIREISLMALGLRACFDAGIVFDKELITKIRDWWIKQQEQTQAKAEVLKLDAKLKKKAPRRRGSKTVGATEVLVQFNAPPVAPRGWGYNAPTKVWGSMSVGAVGALCIYDYILGKDWRKDKNVLEGLQWINKNFTVT